MVIIWDIRSLRNEPPHMVARFRAHGLDRSPVGLTPLAAVLASGGESSSKGQASTSNLSGVTDAGTIISAACPEVLSLR